MVRHYFRRRERSIILQKFLADTGSATSPTGNTDWGIIVDRRERTPHFPAFALPAAARPFADFSLLDGILVAPGRARISVMYGIHRIHSTLEVIGYRLLQ